MGFKGLEPKINHFEVVKNFHEMARHVEGNKGCTLLTMPKGSLTQQLLQSAQYASICHHPYWVEHRIQTHGDMSVDQPYVIIIANNIFNGTRNKDLNERALLVANLGCEMPTVQELVVQGVFTNRIFNELLYVNHPWTYAYPSLQAKGGCFVVGGSSFQDVMDAFYPSFRKALFGVSGRRVLKKAI
jgi:hypothetical protein